MKHSGLKGETESLILSTQDQTITNIYNVPKQACLQPKYYRSMSNGPHDREQAVEQVVSRFTVLDVHPKIKVLHQK